MVVQHVLLLHRAAALHRGNALVQAECFVHPAVHRGLAHEAQRALVQGAAEAAKHRPEVHRLRSRDRCIRVAHRGRGDEAALQNQRGLDAEEGRLPEHQVGPLAFLDAADLVRDAVGDGGVDRVLGDVALDSRVVIAGGIPRQRAALQFHLVRRLPGADDDLADAAHRLRVGAHHADRAEVVQHVFGGDGLAADAALGEGEVFGDRRVEVVAHHQHVEVLVDGVRRVWHRRIGRRRQEVLLADHSQDVRRMAAACAFGVKGAQRAALRRGHRVFDEARFVQRVAVDRDLRVGLVGHAQATVDRRRCRAPVLVQLQADRAGLDLLAQRLRLARVALAEKAQVHGERIGRLQHARQVLGARGAGGREGAGGRAGAPAEHRRHAARERLFDLLRADEMDVAVDAAGGDDHPFGRDDFGARADDDVDTRLHVGVAGLADLRDDDAPMVDDQRIGQHAVDGVARTGTVDALALPHPVANRLAAAELHFLAVDGEVALDLDDEIGVGQPHAVAGGRAEHLGVGAALNAWHFLFLRRFKSFRSG